MAWPHQWDIVAGIPNPPEKGCGQSSCAESSYSCVDHRGSSHPMFMDAFSCTFIECVRTSLLHKILSPWLFAVSMGLSSFILSSLESLKPQLFMSSFKNERKTLKINKALVPHFCGPAPLVHVICRPARSVSKGVGADPCESQKGASLFLKTHFGLILDDSRRNLDVDGSLLGGSCIPKLKELIPWWEELIPLKEGFIPLKVDLVTSLHCTIN